jgi:hypothetical protein
MNFSGDWMRGIMQRLDEAAAGTRPLFATEYTADGPVSWFKVDSMETLHMLEEIERFAFDEADYWGGFKAYSSIDEANAGAGDEVGGVPVQGLKKKPVLKQATVKKIYDQLPMQDPADVEPGTEDAIQAEYQDLLDPYMAQAGEEDFSNYFDNQNKEVMHYIGLSSVEEVKELEQRMGPKWYTLLVRLGINNPGRQPTKEDVQEMRELAQQYM